MKAALPLIGLALLFAATGCSGGSDMSKQEEENFKHHPPMTDADRKKMTDAMAAGAASEKDHERQWRAAHPEEAKKMDAERAARGLPPLGK